MAAVEHYNGRITWFVLQSSIVAATGGLVFGYATGITGGVASMEAFLKKFFPKLFSQMEENTKTSNYCKFDSQMLTLFTSCLFISGLLASFLASLVTSALGRKASLLIGGASFIAGSALGGAANNMYMLIVARILQGFAIGFINQSAPLYLSEMAPPKYRGAFNSSFQFFIGIGSLFAFLINYAIQKIHRSWGWRISLAMAAGPALILTLGGLFLPETPNNLVQRGCHQQKAKKMLQKIRGTEDVQAELDDLIAASQASKSLKNPFKTILERKYRPQLVMSVAIPFFQQVTGIAAISFYTPQLFNAAGSGVSASLMSTVIMALVGIPMVVVSSLTVDRIGRRALFHIGGVLMFVSQVMVGVIMAAKLGDEGALSRGYSMAVLVLVCLCVAAFGLSWGPLGWLVTSEIFPLEIRSAAQSINVAVGFVLTFVGAQAFLAMLCHMKAGIFFFFAGWVAIMTGFVYVFLPETKDVPIEKMEMIWREHWFWRRFVVVEDGDENIREF